MKTGKTVPAPVSIARSGVSASREGVAVARIRATRAAVPGPAAEDSSGLPVRAATRVPVCGSVATAVPAGGGAESHITGAGAVNTARPARSLALTLPAASAPMVTPAARTPRLNVASAGSAAAARVLTTSTSLNPPCASTVTRRSMSGITFGYVAVAPPSTGVGRNTGNDSDSDFPAAVTVASGPLPPPDNTTPLVVTAGATVPSARRVNVGSSDFHEEPIRLRTGTAARVNVNVPAGSATRVSVGVVAASTGTGLCVRRAWANACPSVTGPAEAAVEGAFGGAAWPAGTATNTDTIPTATTATARERPTGPTERIITPPRVRVQSAHS